jgi:predicted dithiol-disulfide oxidoreductase (DUF899 family)
MTKHKTGTRDEWLAARLELLKTEKELTYRSDQLAKQRQELPWVRIDKKYSFDIDKGKASLADLFMGRSQLLVYHFMFGPDYKAGCPSCTSIADGFDGIYQYLAKQDVTLLAISRAPLEKLQTYKQQKGWNFPWASSFGSDFNFDFNVSFTEEQQQGGDIEYNFRQEPAWKTADGSKALAPEGLLTKDQKGKEAGPVDKNASITGTDSRTYTRERPGMSAFVLEDGVVYHTYSAYSRGLDILWSMYQWLDRAPKGRG